MTIRSITAFTAALWDWGFLDRCFGGTKIKISDVDGIVERNGCFLLLEGKPVGKAIGRGQEILFRQLTSKGFTVMIIRGVPPVPERMQIWYAHHRKPEPEVAVSEQDIQERVTAWYKWANANGSRH